MNKPNKSQLLQLLVLVFLLIMTPLLPSSLKSPYLYFIINYLIIALGADAGLFPVFSRSLEEKKQSVSVIQKPITLQEDKPGKKEGSSTTAVLSLHEPKETKPKVVEKCVSEKIIGINKVVDKVNKCPSMPSLFFIGGGESEAEAMDEEFEAEDDGQELFAKAETFIGNFYKQLKMQREESWKNIHEFYQKNL
ncbi:hypothetical protein L6164_031097 [Bauhinia variegata]|uniref:Uncharacterized protein n=1 Tax=Bauhinia variegata TaxID=167791 RepID=A0ACB9LED9_BAUVA|nr:hypothetical protein L6164_031097 [Bauhinia variegata]